MLIFTAGQTPKTEKMIRNLKGMLKEKLVDGYSLEVVDVLKTPELAEQQNILATPTIIKNFPGPKSKIIGDLSNPDKVMSVLGMMNHTEESV